MISVVPQGYRGPVRDELREMGGSVVHVEVPADTRTCELREYGSSVVLVELGGKSYTYQPREESSRDSCPRWDLMW